MENNKIIKTYRLLIADKKYCFFNMHNNLTVYSLDQSFLKRKKQRMINPRKDTEDNPLSSWYITMYITVTMFSASFF